MRPAHSHRCTHLAAMTAPVSAAARREFMLDTAKMACGMGVIGLGLGLLNKLLEGWAGAVVAKILVLVFIIAFIQKRPQGIFALKGRFADS